MDLRRGKRDSLSQDQGRIASEGSQNPQEWLLILIVGFGRDVIVLEIPLSVEGNLSGFNFPVFLVHFVANQHNWDVLADSCEILVPLGNVFVGDSGGDIKHHDGGIGSNVVAFSQSSKLFLTGSVP